jgi:hypothetical protein
MGVWWAFVVGCGVAWENGLGCRDGGDPHTIIKYWDAGLGRWGVGGCSEW